MKKEYMITVNEDTKEIMNSCLSDYSLEDLFLLKEETKKAYFKKLVDSQYVDTFEYVCPVCHKTHICKAGKNEKGEQRYKCMDCGKRFIARSNTLMHWSHLTIDQWQTIFYSTLNNDSFAELVGISVTSTFYDRHKLLYVLVQLMNKDILFDRIELDETYISYQEKGYERKGKRGLSEDKIAIACAIDNHGHTVLGVGDRGRPLSDTLIEIFKYNIQKNSKVISDSQRTYHPVMKALQVEWIKIDSGEKEKDGETLSNINQLHSRIKTFIRGKRNFMTHYLQGYLALFQYKLYHTIMIGTKKFEESFRMLNSIFSGIRNKDICSGENLYVTFYKV